MRVDLIEREREKAVVTWETFMMERQMEEDKDERIISLTSRGEKKMEANKWEAVGGWNDGESTTRKEGTDIAAGSLFKRI